MARRVSVEDQRAELRGKIKMHEGGAREERFRDELRELNARQRKGRTERQDVRLPGSALLITIGLFILWLAATGNLKKIGAAWDFIRGKTENLPTSGVANNRFLPAGIMDFSNYHVETHLAQPALSVQNPGGLN